MQSKNKIHTGATKCFTLRDKVVELRRYKTLIEKHDEVLGATVSLNQNSKGYGRNIPVKNLRSKLFGKEISVSTYVSRGATEVYCQVNKEVYSIGTASTAILDGDFTFDSYELITDLKARISELKYCAEDLSDDWRVFVLDKVLPSRIWSA